jgi:hypothetical protein
MKDDKNQFQERKEITYLGESRERIQRKLELLLEGIPECIERAKSGDTEYTAVYLSAIEKIVVSVLEEESIAYEKYVTKQD